MNKGTLFLIGIGLFILALGIFFFGSSGGFSGVTGTVYVTVANTSAADPAVSSITLTVDRVELWDDEERGWFDVSSDVHAVSLTDLYNKDAWQIVTKKDVRVGEYERVRIGISAVEIEEAEGTSTNAFIINDLISLDGTLLVATNTVTSINLDIHANNSFRKTVDGEYAFIPEIKLESRSNTKATERADNTVLFDGGTIDVNQTYGTNANGGMRVNYRLPASVRIEEVGGSLLITERAAPETKPLSNPGLDTITSTRDERQPATTTEEVSDALEEEEVDLEPELTF